VKMEPLRPSAMQPPTYNLLPIFAGLEDSLASALTTRLCKAVLGDGIAAQLLMTEAPPLVEPAGDSPSENGTHDAVPLPDADMSDAAIRNLFFLVATPSFRPQSNGGGRIVLELQQYPPVFEAGEVEDPCQLLPYPQLPYYKEVVKVVRLWVAGARFPLSFPPLQSLSETCDEAQRLDLLTPDVQRIAGSWPTASDADRSELCLDLLKLLGPRGVLSCLRMRRTQGSCTTMCPPPLPLVVAAFNSTGKGRQTLTEGARAVSKHFHRDATNKFWGDNRGSDAEKNRQANGILRRLFREAVWLNVHQLPHETTICEIRTVQGYGARWSGDGNFFRGFLEPHVADGHERGWRH